MLSSASFAQAAIYNKILKSARMIRCWFYELKLIPNDSDTLENYDQCIKHINWILKDYNHFIDSIVTTWPDLTHFVIAHSDLIHRNENYSFAAQTNYYIDQLIKQKKSVIEFPDTEVDDPMVKRIVNIFNGEMVRFLDEDVDIKFDHYRDPITIMDVAFENYTKEMVEKKDKLRKAGELVL